MSQFWDQYVLPGLDQVTRNLKLIKEKQTGPLLWKRVALWVATPAVALCMINVYRNGRGRGLEQERPPFVKYEHLRRRNKRFPWGNGERSLFHNRNTNALTNGYEE